MDVEELTSNWQQRVDELIALEAIYGEDFRIAGTTNAEDDDVTAEALAEMPMPEQPTHIYCSIRIHVELPTSRLQVCLSMPPTLPPPADPPPEKPDASANGTLAAGTSSNKTSAKSRVASKNRDNSAARSIPSGTSSSTAGPAGSSNTAGTAHRNPHARNRHHVNDAEGRYHRNSVEGRDNGKSVGGRNYGNSAEGRSHGNSVEGASSNHAQHNIVELGNGLSGPKRSASRRPSTSSSMPSPNTSPCTALSPTTSSPISSPPAALSPNSILSPNTTLSPNATLSPNTTSRRASYATPNTALDTACITAFDVAASTATPRRPSTPPSTPPSRACSTSPSEAPTTRPTTAHSTSPSAAPTTGPSTPPRTPPSTAPNAAPSVAANTLSSMAHSTSPSIGPTTGPSTPPSTPPSTAPSIGPSTSPSTSLSAAPITASTPTPSTASSKQAIAAPNHASNPASPTSDPAPPTSTPGNPAHVIVPMGPRVQHLTPLHLKLKLPPDYPSQRMPLYKMVCSWMDEEQIQSAAARLEALWEEEGRGLPYCFAWIEWLQSQLLAHLGVSEYLVLSSKLLGGAPDPSDGKPGSSGASASSHSTTDRVQHMEDVALGIVRYSNMREQAKFDQGTWRCCICFEDAPGPRCLRLPECGHFFCRDCITQHCSTKVKDGSVDNIFCPIPDCRLQVPPYILRQLLTEAEFHRWEELLLSRTLDRMEDVVYCPRCKTSTVEDKDHCAQCPRCYYTFCSLCNDAWHTGERCVDPVTRLRILEERTTGSRSDAGKMAAQHQDLINQVKSLKLVSDTTRSCPSCQMAIQKSEGCNKMVCSYCSAIFCYKCGKQITGYDHFGSRSCELFDAEAINRWNNMVNNGWEPEEGRREHMEHGQAQVQVARMMGQQFLLRLCNCPVCGQANLKTNNNNAMRCWACGCAFCYRCKSFVRGKVGMHFKPKGMCVQHSDD